jgi:flagellar basal body rod protein FlgG
MVQMLTSLRTYQSDQQAIQAIDETLKEGIQAGGA